MKTRWLMVPAAALSLLVAPFALEHANAEYPAPAAPAAPVAPADKPAASAEPVQAPNGAGAEAADASSADAADSGETADGSADAAPAPTYPAFNEAPFPDAPTPMPKAKEWESAPRVVFDSRSTHLLLNMCHAQRLREWIRLRCTGPSIGAISLLGGNRDGLSFHMDPIPDEWLRFPEGAEVVFPVRRGDRRVIEWLQISWGYHGPNSIEPFLLLSEEWLPDDPLPTILLS